jgi:hypothetical protein
MKHAPLPREISPEERARMWSCLKDRWFVSAYTCFQCKHYEVNNQVTTLVTKSSGACMYPNVASRPSRRITSLFAAKVDGQVGWDAKGLIDADGNPIKVKSSRTSGGMTKKRYFMISLIKKGASRTEVLQAARKQFPEMKKAYANTLYYHAVKEAKAKSPGK